MRTTTLQEIRELAAVHGIVVAGVICTFTLIGIVQAIADAITRA